MRPRTGLLLGLLALAACGDEDRTQTGYTPSNDRSSTSSDDTTTVPARVVPGRTDTLPDPPPPQDTVALALAPLGTATVRGSGQLAAAGTVTAVSVALAGGAGGATYEGAIRQGACARMGPAVASLVPATADSLGNGAAASDVPVPLDRLLGGPHVVVYGRGGRPESCGVVGRASAPPPPDTVA
ncbi:MAG TPA: hypothetical protein VHG28_23945 [Longimicrobiaceae bacterium]|nr:hypothetical protein [Longimicrobiaceae bacterium]